MLLLTFTKIEDRPKNPHFRPQTYREWDVLMCHLLGNLPPSPRRMFSEYIDPFYPREKPELTLSPEFLTKIKEIAKTVNFELCRSAVRDGDLPVIEEEGGKAYYGGISNYCGPLRPPTGTSAAMTHSFVVHKNRAQFDEPIYFIEKSLDFNAIPAKV